jgi:hypothetical protein
MMDLIVLGFVKFWTLLESGPQCVRLTEGSNPIRGRQTMMKLTLIATTCIAASGLASAQGAPEAAASAAPRTGLYTGVTKGNAAADNTVDDYSRRPTLIGDRQYLAGYGNGDLGNGAYSLKGKGFNWFGQVVGQDSMSTLRLGLASGTAWGAGLLAAVDRIHAQAGNNTVETTTYYEPSGLGLFGDFNLGSSDVYGEVGFHTGLDSTGGLQNSVWTKPVTGPEDDDQNHTLNVMAGWKKDATTEGTHALNVEVLYLMQGISLENPKVSTTMTQVRVNPSWGYILKANSSYSVFLGANGMLDFIHPEDGNIVSIALTPNIALHKQLGRGFEGFSGFSVTGLWSDEWDTAAEGFDRSQMVTMGSDMAIGLRWVKDNLAFEGGLKESVLANGPYIIGGNAGQGLFYNIGLSLGI